MATAVAQALKWHGGKNYLAQKLVALMPPHLNYVEPYFGGGAVLFARDPDDETLWLKPHKGVSEAINDLNEQLTNFWRVIQSDIHFLEFRRRVEATPFSGHEFDLCLRRMGSDHHFSPCARAWSFFVVNRLSLAGRMKSFSGITKTRTRSRMNNEVSAWLNAIEGLPEVHARLNRVLILSCQPAVEVIRKFDTSDSLVYCDPPYLHETRAKGATNVYEYEMTEDDHAELAETLNSSKAKIMLSGYPSPQYDEWYSHWRRVDFDLPNNSAGGKTKQRKTECVWMNY